MRKTLPDYALPELTLQLFEEMRAELLQLRYRWNQLTPGETLELSFTLGR